MKDDATCNKSLNGKREDGGARRFAKKKWQGTEKKIQL
jgi:hypothetical protein